MPYQKEVKKRGGERKEKREGGRDRRWVRLFHLECALLCMDFVTGWMFNGLTLVLNSHCFKMKHTISEGTMLASLSFYDILLRILSIRGSFKNNSNK